MWQTSINMHGNRFTPEDLKLREVFEAIGKQKKKDILFIVTDMLIQKRGKINLQLNIVTLFLQRIQKHLNLQE